MNSDKAHRSIGELVKPVKRVDPSKELSGEFRYVDLSAIDPGDRVLSRRTLLGVGEAPSRARQLLESGDVLFATVRPYQGKVAIVTAEDEGAVASTGFTVLRANNELDPRYLLHALTSDYFLSQILPLQRGTSYPAVSDKDVFSCKIAVPTIEQQHEIVERIETALVKIDTVREALIKIAQKADSAMNGVLHFAVSSSELGMPVSLGDVTQPRREKVDPKNSALKHFIGLEHVESNTGRLTGKAPLSTVSSSATRISSGDVIYSRLRPYLNKVHLSQNDYAGSAEFIVFPETKELAQKYLMYLLRSPDFLKFAALLDTGDRPRVNWAGIKQFQFALPSVEDQLQIVAQLERQLLVFEAVKTRSANCIRDLDALKRSILNDDFAVRNEVVE